MKPNYLFPGPDRENILDLCMDMALALGPEKAWPRSWPPANTPNSSSLPTMMSAAAAAWPQICAASAGDAHE